MCYINLARALLEYFYMIKNSQNRDSENCKRRRWILVKQKLTLIDFLCTHTEQEEAGIIICFAEYSRTKLLEMFL